MRTDASIQQIIDEAQNNDDIIEKVDDFVTKSISEIGSAAADFFTPPQKAVTSYDGGGTDLG